MSSWLTPFVFCLPASFCNCDLISSVGPRNVYKSSLDFGLFLNHPKFNILHTLHLQSENKRHIKERRKKKERRGEGRICKSFKTLFLHMFKTSPKQNLTCNSSEIFKLKLNQSLNEYIHSATFGIDESLYLLVHSMFRLIASFFSKERYFLKSLFHLT